MFGSFGIGTTPFNPHLIITTADSAVAPTPSTDGIVMDNSLLYRGGGWIGGGYGYAIIVATDIIVAGDYIAIPIVESRFGDGGVGATGRLTTAGTKVSLGAGGGNTSIGTRTTPP